MAFYAGDDADTKAAVAGLLDQLGAAFGARPVADEVAGHGTGRKVPRSER
ncbi:hypothetical protein [Streptomyces sp. NPDC058092]